MRIWTEWWSWVKPLREACSRSRSFLWLLAALAGISVRKDLLGVTSIVRALGLGGQYYDRLLDFFHSKAEAQFTGMDRAYRVSESCKACGTCARICPRGNIALESGKPAWHHDCEFCGACGAWCPNNAIGFAGAPSAPRRHNPQVTAADLMRA